MVRRKNNYCSRAKAQTCNEQTCNEQTCNEQTCNEQSYNEQSCALQLYNRIRAKDVQAADGQRAQTSQKPSRGYRPAQV
jgi:hypothetical protein